MGSYCRRNGTSYRKKDPRKNNLVKDKKAKICLKLKFNGIWHKRYHSILEISTWEEEMA